MQKARLYWIDPADGPREYALEQEPLIIGRDMRNQIVLHAADVSRRHAMIEYDGDQVVINDLHSRNGIWLNGQRVHRAALMDGARIQIGELIFTFSIERPALVSAQSSVPTSVPNDASLVAAGIGQAGAPTISSALRFPSK